jgi:hypothetical protein
VAAAFSKSIDILAPAGNLSNLVPEILDSRPRWNGVAKAVKLTEVFSIACLVWFY